MRLNTYSRRNPHPLPLIQPILLPDFAVSFEDSFKLVGITSAEIIITHADDPDSLTEQV